MNVRTNDACHIIRTILSRLHIAAHECNDCSRVFAKFTKYRKVPIRSITLCVSTRTRHLKHRVNCIEITNTKNTLLPIPAPESVRRHSAVQHVGRAWDTGVDPGSYFGGDIESNNASRNICMFEGWLKSSQNIG